MGPRLLVTGAGTGPGNNVIRSLRAGDASFTIVGCHHDRFALRKAAADRKYLVPAAAHRGYLPALRRVIDAERIDVLIPTGDAEAGALVRARTAVPCRVFLPSRRVVELCRDKYRVSAFLRARGVPAPLTYPVRSLDRIGETFRRLKPRDLVWCRVRAGSGAVGATAVRTPEQARAWIRLWRELRGVPVTAFSLCEYLPGRDFGCQSLWQEGRLVLVKTFERVSYFAGASNLSGVSSVAALAKSVHEPRVAEVCTAAVRAVDRRASGLYQVDSKENAQGMPCVTEINAGRFGLSTHLFDLIGKHNMALAYVHLALGLPVEVGEPYDGAEDYYMVRDLDTLPDVFHADEFFEGIEDVRT